MAFVAPPEPGFVAGRPYVYGLHYPDVDGWYVGKNETGSATYMGSPSQAALLNIADAHQAVGMDTVPEPTKRLFWSPPNATRKACCDQEWYWIARVRASHDGPVFNLFPIEDWTDHFSWEHDPVTHVDRATNSRWPVVYVKLQASRDAQGRCSGGKAGWYSRHCGGDWGDQAREHWCKVIYPDGREVMLPGANPYHAFRSHKLIMTRGDDPAVRPRVPGKGAYGDRRLEPPPSRGYRGWSARNAQS